MAHSCALHRNRSGKAGPLLWRAITENDEPARYRLRDGGNLPKNEPKRLAEWEEDHVYEMLQEKNKDTKPFVLHDGPPYANGPIHLGHAQNKISKDIINRYKAMRGFRTPYVPGWDCHGQPIEHKVETMLGTEKFNQLPTEKVRELCRKMAVEQVDTQRQGFKRLGVLAEWENPYLTYVNDYDATDVEIFKAYLRPRCNLSRPQAGALVFALPYGARRGGNRVRRRGQPCHLRALRDDDGAGWA